MENQMEPCSFLTSELEQQAKEAAEKKLERIIKRYGDADGERRKPYYMEQLISEARTALCWRMITDLLMFDDKENAPKPTKVTGALSTCN